MSETENKNKKCVESDSDNKPSTTKSYMNYEFVTRGYSLESSLIGRFVDKSESDCE